MITLGKKYKDKHSKFVGIATGRTVYLYGCVRVLLESPTKKNSDGAPVELWFDEQRLISMSKPPPGGPRSAPKRNLDGRRH